MRVRDDLTGNEYSPRDILWIQADDAPREKTITHTFAIALECGRTRCGALPWGLSADGDCWTPITILEVP